MGGSISRRALFGLAAAAAAATLAGCRSKSSMTAPETELSIGTVLTVNPDGTGDFTTPKAANDAIALRHPSSTNRFTINIHAGTYTDIQWTVQPYTTWIGVGRPGEVWFKGEQPDSTSDADSVNNSTIQLQGSTTLIGLKISAKNMRYAVHDEADGLNPEASHIVRNCHIEHFGNRGIIDYRMANSLPAGAPWSFDAAWGQGSASGLAAQFTDTLIRSARSWPVVVHNNASFDKATDNTYEKCRFLGPTECPATIVLGLGSGQVDHLAFTDCEFGAGQYILEADDPWIRTDLDGQYAQHSEYQIRATGSVVGFKTTNRGMALRITSASTGSTSNVRVSGTAAPVILGTAPSKRDGGGGVRGYLWGGLDISGILVGLDDSTTVNNTLGRRLGDCSTAPKTLTVTVDGGSPKNVVFDTNLTVDRLSG